MISLPLEFSSWPNWFVGNARTASLSENFSQSSFICVKSLTVVPHKEAVFSTSTTLPRYWSILIISPSSRLVHRRGCESARHRRGELRDGLVPLRHRRRR